jgi:lipopolysaccharide export system protein LptA
MNRAHRIVFCALALFGGTIAAYAQGSQNVPNALQGFSQNRDKPIQIKAQSFEVRDRDKKATFSGNVQVLQGDATIRCRTLIVTYSSDTGPAALTSGRIAQSAAGGKSQISKLEALGGVVVTQKDQTATGDAGVFDLNTKIITLTGHVVISQGGNVMRGDRMMVDLNSGVSRIESDKAKGPVQMIIPQSPSNAPAANANKPSLMPGMPAAPPQLDLLRPAQPN